MTEDQIERRVEGMVNRLDAAFLANTMTQAEYDRRMADINAWADKQFRGATS